ncbi:hypothetical protein AVEN_84201-1 [Araneus ventricosus]|uniref:Uncharacterized protein n=1 Tax=Araneus ventricosus TaxID=182803 RepID=A0A4Y2T599_ARAVE|nr:hypothetical protein AVEN_84201-1 [Araneus ventricosus]
MANITRGSNLTLGNFLRTSRNPAFRHLGRRLVLTVVESKKRARGLTLINIIKHMEGSSMWKMGIVLEQGLPQIPFNSRTPKPAVIGHVTCKLVWRISAGHCSESGKKAVGRVVIKRVLGVERRDERPSIPIREMFLLHQS